MAANDLFMRLNRAGLVFACVRASEGHFKLAGCIVQATPAQRTRQSKKGGDDDGLAAGYVHAALAVQTCVFPHAPSPVLWFPDG